MNFFNTGLIFNPEVFILCQNVCGRGNGSPRPRAVDFDIPVKTITQLNLNNHFIEIIRILSLEGVL